MIDNPWLEHFRAKGTKPRETPSKNRRARMRPPLGLRRPSRLMRAQTVADYYSGAWQDSLRR